MANVINFNGTVNANEKENIMTTEFIKDLETEMQTLVEANETVEIHEVIKNNDVKLHDITIRKENQVVAPQIYLENYITEDTNLDAIHEIARDLVGTYRNIPTENKYDDATKLLFDYDGFCKANVMPRLVNKASNEALFSNGVAHVDFLSDLAIIPVVNLDEKACTKVTETLLKQWGKTVDEVVADAKANLNETDFYVKDMADIMLEIYGEMMGEIPTEMLAEINSMRGGQFVLTNAEKTNGANQILRKANLTTHAVTHGIKRLAILPSSVHEVILLPIDGFSESDLTEMVQSVNASEVRDDEILSDHVYIFNTETCDFE